MTSFPALCLKVGANDPLLEVEFGPWTPQSVGGDNLPGFSTNNVHTFKINSDGISPIELSEFAMQLRLCEIFNVQTY